MRKTIFFLVLLMLLYSDLHSKPLPFEIKFTLGSGDFDNDTDSFDDDGDGPPVEDPPPPMPLDAGLPYLVITGLVYVGYKLSNGYRFKSKLR